MDVAKAVLLAAAFTGVFASAVTSQEQQTEDVNQRAILDAFDDEHPSLVLGGQIDFQTGKSSWLVYLFGGKLVMENRLNPQSLHYNDITWVLFPGSEMLESAEDLQISALVEGANSGPCGVGILVGSGKAGIRKMFAVDGQGLFQILKRDGRKLTPVHRARHEAVLAGALNEVAFEVRGANVAFLVNGAEIIEIP